MSTALSLVARRNAPVKAAIGWQASGLEAHVGGESLEEKSAKH